jgi:hypothetical protein
MGRRIEKYKCRDQVVKAVKHIIVVGRSVAFLVGGWRLKMQPLVLERAVRETRCIEPPLLTLENDVTFLHQNTTTRNMYHSSIESIEAAEDPQKGGGNIFGISAHIIRGMLRCFACNHPQLLDSHLLLVRLQRPFAPGFQRIEARRSLKNSDDLHRLQRFRASIFAPLPRERLFGNVAGEGGEGQESGSKLG